jgi:hypothetical protein
MHFECVAVTQLDDRAARNWEMQSVEMVHAGEGRSQRSLICLEAV